MSYSRLNGPIHSPKRRGPGETAGGSTKYDHSLRAGVKPAIMLGWRADSSQESALQLPKKEDGHAYRPRWPRNSSESLHCLARHSTPTAAFLPQMPEIWAHLQRVHTDVSGFLAVASPSVTTPCGESSPVVHSDWGILFVEFPFRTFFNFVCAPFNLADCAERVSVGRNRNCWYVTLYHTPVTNVLRIGHIIKENQNVGPR